MPCKTKSCQSSTECLRMVRALTLDTPRPHQFHLKQWKNMLLWTTRFFSFLLVFCPYVAGVLVEKNNCWSAKWLRSNNGIIKYLWLSMDIHGYTWISMGPMGAKKQQKAAEKHKNLVFHKQTCFHNSGWNWGGLGVSGGSAQTIRRHSVEHGVRKSTFQHLTVTWNLNVLEMAFKTLHFVQGLSWTPLLFIPRYLTNIFPEHILQKKNLHNRQSGNPNTQVH